MKAWATYASYRSLSFMVTSLRLKYNVWSYFLANDGVRYQEVCCRHKVNGNWEVPDVSRESSGILKSATCLGSLKLYLSTIRRIF